MEIAVCNRNLKQDRGFRGGIFFSRMCLLSGERSWEETLLDGGWASLGKGIWGIDVGDIDHRHRWGKRIPRRRHDDAKSVAVLYIISREALLEDLERSRGVESRRAEGSKAMW